MMRLHFWLGLLFLAGAAVLSQINLPAVQAYTPAQRDFGAQVYIRRCSTCHGDKGQGLTLEWRQTWPETHQNCSTPKCHGRQHPPDGFEIKDNYAPAVIGPGTLTRFRTAQDLFTFISTTMPMHAPGSLTQDEYWALTAFLLAAHGVPADSVPLDSATASRIALASGTGDESLPALPDVQGGVLHPPTMDDGQQTTDASPASPVDTGEWWPAVAGVGLAVVLLGLAGVALRQARR
ncbi:MAG: hypothetical protein C4311_00480 [Chloroflexota bacterium]